MKNNNFAIESTVQNIMVDIKPLFIGYNLGLRLIALNIFGIEFLSVKHRFTAYSAIF